MEITTVEELKEEKRFLELEILKRIKEFEKKFKVTVESVDLSFINRFGRPVNEVVDVELYIKI